MKKYKELATNDIANISGGNPAGMLQLVDFQVLVQVRNIVKCLILF